MVIPTMNETLSEALRVLADGKHHMRKGILKRIYIKFSMTDEEQAKKTAGGASVVESRMHWAIYHLKIARLVEVLPQKELLITKNGAKWASTYKAFRLADLKKIEAYKKWVDKVSGPRPMEPETPDEELDRVLQEYKKRQIDDAREQIMSISAFRFEKIVMDLLEKMGYGRGTTTKKSHDGGIDGIVDVDKLGIGKVFMQAKRWRNNVGSKELQAFAGSLSATKSKQGVFITTSNFTPDAQEFAKNANVNMVLVDGEEFLERMYEHGVGFTSEKGMEIKGVDKGYFSG